MDDCIRCGDEDHDFQELPTQDRYLSWMQTPRSSEEGVPEHMPW